MKRTYYACVACILMLTHTLSAQDTDVAETTRDSRLGVSFSQGISFLERQVLSNQLNTRETTTQSGGYALHTSVFMHDLFDGHDGFMIYRLDYNLYSHSEIFYDTRFDIAKGEALETDGRNWYHTVGASIGYGYVWSRGENYDIFTSLDISLRYLFRHTISIDFTDGEEKVIKTGRRIPDNLALNYNPTFNLTVGIEYDLFGFENLQTSLILKKDAHYLIKSPIPVFNTLMVDVGLPLFSF